MSSYDYDYGLPPSDIAVIAIYSISLVATFVIAVLGCVYAKKFAPFSRPHGLSGIVSSASFAPVAFALNIAWVAIRNEYLWGSFTSSSLVHLTAVSNLFYFTLQGMVLLTQYEMAVGFYQIAKGRLPSIKPIPVARMIGTAAVIVYMIIVIAYFGCYEAYIYSDYNQSIYSDEADYIAYLELVKAINGLSFTLTLLVFFASFAIIIHTSLAPRLQGHRGARVLLIVAAVVSLISSLYRLILSGIFDLAIFTNTFFDFQEWLPGLNAAFGPLALTVVLILLFAAGKAKTTDATTINPAWNPQQGYQPAMAFQPVGYPQQAAYPQQGQVYAAPPPQQYQQPHQQAPYVPEPSPVSAHANTASPPPAPATHTATHTTSTDDPVQR